MQDRPKRVTTNGDSERPNVARLFDYYLGGAHNFAIDRKLGEESSDFPAAEMVRSIRSFLRRVVKICVERGIRQFLDLGSGIPTAGNVHEIAVPLDPTCRVVYVDFDPVAVAHSRTMLRDNKSATIVEADLRDARAVVNHPETRSLIDFNEPVAVFLIGVLPCLTGPSEPTEVIEAYRALLAPGSIIAVTHLTNDVEPELIDKLIKVADMTDTPLVPRSKKDVEEAVAGLELLDPGLVLAAHWRADGDLPSPSPAADATSYGAVGVVR
ncbi:hypothetical protein Lesp02_20700 [Lentzea sp. NBRC 105346]|uniref:SAM-dependent methyltransferase n=1 Tax=Lentzea sp. NBRC 105346 TaxID=3032205 RepID=UPI0024A0DB39|nr:SAM-dependent methyltransferase [Lentzea sp. NBRC 105346]GLZ29880.1 hypothetical protein Lesp02_20700 [Lentzea sp. NBRC 105346]